MNSEPDGFDRDALRSALCAWDLSVSTLTYLPVGAGSHHYLALDSDGRRSFVTVDELITKLFGVGGPTFMPWVEVDLDAAFDALNRAFATAVALRDAGLEFVTFVSGCVRSERSFPAVYHQWAAAIRTVRVLSRSTDC